MQAEATSRVSLVKQPSGPGARAVRCPFHYEVSPGCALLPSGWFRCFGCGARGWWTRVDDEYVRLTREAD